MATWHKAVSTAIDTAIDNPLFIALYRRWQAARDADGGTPALAAFDANALPELAPNLIVLEAVGGNFIYRYYGGEIARHRQSDMTGKRVTNFGGDDATFFVDCYRRVIHTQVPLYTIHFASRAPLVLTWERLMVPLKDATGRDWVGEYCVPMEMRPQLLEAVLNANSDAILALRAVPAANGDTDDWLILVANDGFARLMGVPAKGLAGRKVAEVFPRWPQLGLAEYCCAAIQDREDHQCDIELAVDAASGVSSDGSDGEASDIDSRTFTAYFAPLGDGCVMRLADVTALKHAERSLHERTAQLQSDNSQLAQLASKDSLTGLFNRRALDTYLERELAHARRSGESLSLALCDIDHFKAYNDFYGHVVGDDVIGEVAAVLSTTTLRPGDMAARFGGEEFVLVMRQTNLVGALEVVHRAQDLLRQRAVRHAASSTGEYLTLSFGVAEFSPMQDDNPAALLARTDAALYRAKQNGRNRIEVDK